MAALQRLEAREAELELRGRELDRTLAELRLSAATTPEEAEAAAAELETLKGVSLLSKLRERFETQETRGKCEAAAREAEENASGAMATDANILMRAKVRAVTHVLTGMMDEAFVEAGYAAGEGETQINKIPLRIQDDRVSIDLREHLNEAYARFRHAEEHVVMRAVLGEERYLERVREEEQMEQLEEEIVDQLNSIPGDDPNHPDRLAYIEKIRLEGARAITKLRDVAGSPEERMRKLGDADKTAIMRFRVLQSLMSHSAGGHSHNGVPCGGHDHSHSHGGGGGHDHSHSHGGGGHDHAHSHDGGQQPQHGHSHNGVPCGGHGHSHG